MTEILVSVMIVGFGTLAAMPALEILRTHGRLAAAARDMALRVQALRWRAVASNRAHGLWFVRRESGWAWFEVQDGDGDGLRLADLRAGIDVELSGPHRIEERFSGIRLGLPGGAQIPRIPPGRGWLADDGDPIRFGASNIVTCSPLGTASSGTIYLTDGRRAARGVVVFGPTARVRVWRFAAREGRWRR